MTTQSSQGIQTLLEAEKEASKIVQKARQYRVQRLKDAKTEATKEIEALKQQKQQEFTNYEKQFLSSTDTTVAAATAETEQKLIEIKNAYNENKEKVILKLLERIVDVRPEVHVNAQI